MAPRRLKMNFLSISRSPNERIVWQKNPTGLWADAAETTQPYWKHVVHLEIILLLLLLLLLIIITIILILIIIIIINLKPTSYHHIISDKLWDALALWCRNRYLFMLLRYYDSKRMESNVTHMLEKISIKLYKWFPKSDFHLKFLGFQNLSPGLFFPS